MVKKMTRKQVNDLGSSYHSYALRYGENNMATQRAFIAYMEAKAQYEKQTGKPFAKVKK